MLPKCAKSNFQENCHDSENGLKSFDNRLELACPTSSIFALRKDVLSRSEKTKMIAGIVQRECQQADSVPLV